jgi:hypothetical protein
MINRVGITTVPVGAGVWLVAYFTKFTSPKTNPVKNNGNPKRI